MKVAFQVVMKHAKTGATETILVNAETSNAESEMFQITTRLAEALSGFRVGDWHNLHQSCRVTQCPPGFFNKQQQQHGGAHGQ